MYHRGGCEESIIFIKIPDMLLFPLSVATCVPHHSPSPLIEPLTAESDVGRYFVLSLCSQTYQNIWNTYWESSWPSGSNHARFWFLRLSWDELSLFNANYHGGFRVSCLMTVGCLRLPCIGNIGKNVDDSTVVIVCVHPSDQTMPTEQFKTEKQRYRS
jgi:hypothetical protein